jgi:hypothetical protein
VKFTLMSFEADFDEGIETKGSEIQVEISCDEEAQRIIVCESSSEIR